MHEKREVLLVKRTLMLKNQELLDFEVDTDEREIRILDAPEMDDELLRSLGQAFGLGGVSERDGKLHFSASSVRYPVAPQAHRCGKKEISSRHDSRS